MSKPLALFFALTGVSLLIGVSIALSYRITWLVFLLLLVWIAFTGFGFVVKARSRRARKSGDSAGSPSSD